MGTATVSGLTVRPQRFSARYGARHPWLVSWPRAGLYLMWRALLGGLRPVLFLGFLGIAAVSAVLTAKDLPKPDYTQLSLGEQIDQAFDRALEDRTDRHQVWVDLLEWALQPQRASMPDLVQARSIATSYVAFRGHDALAIELLSDGRHPRHIEAELRALPAWRREQRLVEVIAAARIQGTQQGFEPEELVFAPPAVQVRLRRANALYASTFVEAERWFVEPDGRALALEALPGLTPRYSRVYDDIRDVVVQGCAAAAQTGRASGQCRVGFLPKPASDPIMVGLALSVVGSEPERRAGARLAKAAWAAGVLDPDLAQRLALGPDANLGQAAVMASATRLMVEAGEVWSQPLRFRDAARTASVEASQSANIDRGHRDAVYDLLTALRREVGAIATIRLLDAVRTRQDAEALMRLADVSNGQLLALHALTGADLLDQIGGSERALRYHRSVFDWPRNAQLFASISVFSILFAVALLVASLWQGHLRKQGRRPGLLERLDAGVSRLILGRNL